MKRKRSIPSARARRGPRAEPAGNSLSGSHAFLSQEVANVFQALHVGATLRDETGWYSVHSPPSVVTFEHTHGMAPERYAYNDGSVARVRKSGKTLLTQHAGFWDFFVPVGLPGSVHAILITGPFLRARSTAEDVLERWRSLTGRVGHPSDLEFAHYLATTLETLTLEGEEVGCYQRLLECYAALISERGDALVLASEAAKLRQTLERARAVERTWEAAHSMIDERTERQWLSPHGATDASELPIGGMPEHALVALTASRSDGSDPVDEAIRQDGFQRASVELGRSHRAIAGRVGEHGVVFLLGGAKSKSTLHSRMQDLASRAARVARRSFGLELHFGASAFGSVTGPSLSYDQALRSAEQALSQGLSMVHAEPNAQRTVSPLRMMRQRLGDAGQQRDVLVSRFEQYIDAVGAQCGYRLEPCRIHLEAGFDESAQGLLTSGVLQQRSYADTCEVLERAARSARSATELFAAYRRAIADLKHLAAQPAAVSQERSLRRAITHLHEHFAEPLTVPEVARVAGFAPGYFAQLFQRRERMTFDRYVRKLRIERAKQLLKGTELSVERIGQLAGFPLRPYFFRIFKQSVGITPNAYRKTGPAVDWEGPGPLATAAKRRDGAS